MVYAVAFALVVMVVVVAVIAAIASHDDPMGLGRTMNRSFTQGLDSIFGSRRRSSGSA